MIPKALFSIRRSGRESGRRGLYGVYGRDGENSQTGVYTFASAFASTSSSEQLRNGVIMWGKQSMNFVPDYKLVSCPFVILDFEN
jgi:hypothetical protein